MGDIEGDKMTDMTVGVKRILPGKRNDVLKWILSW
jgi:hypothetical protein